MTGLTAIEVRYEGRKIRSSLRYGKHTTWRRNLANLRVQKGSRVYVNRHASKQKNLALE